MLGERCFGAYRAHFARLGERAAHVPEILRLEVAGGVVLVRLALECVGGADPVADGRRALEPELVAERREARVELLGARRDAWRARGVGRADRALGDEAHLVRRHGECVRMCAGVVRGAREAHRAGVRWR